MPEKDYSFTGYEKAHCDIARKLRKAMTPQERDLWYRFLKDYRVKFYRQRAINNFIVDFYCPRAHLVVELDGGQHYTDAGIDYDTSRTAVLEQYGLTVLRFSNLDIEHNFDGVCKTIHNTVQEKVKE